MAYGTVNTDIVADSSGGKLAPISSVFRNRIINGAMVIAQRGTSGTATSAGSIVLDRFGLYSSNTTPAVTQSSDAPAGFSNSMLWTQSSAATRTSTDYYEIYHKIEGYNVADLNLGTANAKTVTVSFWVKSSVTGTYSVALTNSGATFQNYVSTYTINSANTWEQKNITVAGSTAGTWNITNGSGLEVWWDLGTGSNYQTSTLNSWITGTRTALVSTSQVGFAQTSGATFYLTGVQLEVGSSATGYEYRQYGTEFDLCRRYFERFSPSVNYQNYASGQAFSSTSALGNFYFYPKRAAVTVAYPAASNFLIYNNTATGILATSINAGTLGTNTFEWSGSVASGLTAGNASGLLSNNTLNSYVNISAEL
jgi:hypothetical protein